MSTRDGTPDASPPAPDDRDPPESRWFLLRGGELVHLTGDGPVVLPRLGDPVAAGLPVTATRQLTTGQGEPTPASRAGSLPEDAPLPPGLEATDLRALLSRLSDEDRRLACRASQLLRWDRDHHRCGRCGELTRLHPAEPGRECSSCGFLVYPSPHPAVLVAVSRGEGPAEELLLARSPRFPPGRFSVLAGFVEPGESLEECAEREVAEEVGVRIDGLRYFASQPWPFPNSLMVAFTARYVEGEIACQAGEIVEAGWYRADALPRIPPRPSLSRALIDAFTRRAGGDPTGLPGW